MNFLKAKFDKSGNEDEWNKYKKKRNAVNNLNKKLKREYYFSEFNEHLGDPRKTWKTLKKVSFKKKSGDRIELIKDGYVIDDSECIASIFNEYFTQTASRYDTEHTFNELHELTDNIFSCVSIGEDFVLKELSKLSIFKCSGIDNLHPRLLKLASPFITKPLTHLLNCSLSTGSVPVEWKERKGKRLFLRAETRKSPSNYRPISVLSHIVKILEKAVHSQLFDFLNDNALLSDRQSGFRLLHSTGTALVDVNDFLLRGIDRGLISGALFLDLKRAFDSVNHDIFTLQIRQVWCKRKIIGLV